MSSPALVAQLQSIYPCLRPLGPELQDALTKRQLTAVHAPSGAVLFDEGAPCAGFPLMVTGAVSIVRRSAAGRTLELYRVLPGEVCVISTAALLKRQPIGARAVCVEPVRLGLLSAPLFSRLAEAAEFRDFVLGVFAQRLADLMELVDAVAFQRLDRRLADRLLGHGYVVCVTHQALADELGTVREIVTRVLKQFESAGLVRLGRERIEIQDADRLRRVANGNADAI